MGCSYKGIINIALTLLKQLLDEMEINHFTFLRNAIEMKAPQIV